MPTLYTYSYRKRTIEITTLDRPRDQTLPSTDESLIPPGAGDILIEKVGLSSKKIKKGGGLSVSGIVSGTNIAHIYAEVMLQDTERRILYGPIWREFILAETEEENQGVIYPEWGEKNEVSYEFHATLRLLSDDKNKSFAFLKPERYGFSDECSLEGNYIKPEDGNQYESRLIFDSGGKLVRIVVKSSGKGLGAPRTIHPQPGDQFTPYVQLLISPENDNGSWQEATGVSNKLTFGKKSFTWKQVPAFSGDYAVGFAVKDLDGKVWRRFKSISVHS